MALIAGIFCLMGSSLFAGNTTWLGTTNNNYNNAANWTTSPAYTGDNNQTDIISLDNANLVMAGNIASGVMVCGTGTVGSAPTLNITHNIIGNMGWVSAGAAWAGIQGEPTSGSGIIIQTSGTVANQYAQSMGLNIADYAPGTGTYDFGGTSAGTAPVFEGLVNGGNPGQSQILIGGAGNGTLNLTGYGTIIVQNGYGLTLGNDPVWSKGHAGTGLLSITGGHLSILTQKLNLYGSNSTLSDTIDNTGISTIFSNGTSAGSVTIGNGSIFNLTLGVGFTATQGQVFTIIDSASPFTGTFSGLGEGSIITNSGYVFAVTYTGSSSYGGGDALDLTVTSVPEPQTWAMMVAGFGMLVMGRRRRF